MPDAPFTDLFFQDKPHPSVMYRSGMVVCQEALIKGQYVGRSWNTVGYLGPDYECFPTDEHWGPQAFWLEMDGQLLASHWEWGGCSQAREERGLTVTVELRHAVRPVTIRIKTFLDGTPVLTRWLEITNCGQRDAALSAASPWSGILTQSRFWREEESTPFSVGYMHASNWGQEGYFRWHALPNAGYRIDGRYRRRRHRPPFFVLRNETTGEHFIGSLEWSGGFSIELDPDCQTPGTTTADAPSQLFFRIGPDAPAPLRVLAPGETVSTPRMHLGLVIGDLDAAVQAMHEHLRESVLSPGPSGRTGLVESAIGPEFEITPGLVYHCVDVAQSLGAEVFFVDASWYSAPGTEWFPTVGDWKVGSRFPQGLAPIRDYVRHRGMLFGLWMEPERIGEASELAREKPDWVIKRYDGGPLHGSIDLLNPDAAQWVEAQMERVIREHELDFFRLDWNIGWLGPGGASPREGWLENTYWRYYETLYAIWARLAARHPDVIFENCAGGGGRTDVGMVRFFAHTWVTDWQKAPRSFTITNGMSMALPPERIDRLIFGQSGQVTGNLDFQCSLMVFNHPTFGFTHLIGSRPNPVQDARVRHYVDIYKSFVRPFHGNSRIYHHTPEVDGLDPHGWGALEMVSADRTRAIAGVFRLSDPAAPEYLLRMRGLDIGRRYRVTFDGTGESCLLDGFTLMKTGVTIRREAALTSELLLCEAVE
ncbi:MAG: alpha-galactosidase [Spirochaetia bacterium]|jgi:alpha-galactosidase